MNNNDKCVFQGKIGPDPEKGTLLWDAGDCCGSETKDDFCTDCECKGELENWFLNMSENTRHWAEIWQ